MVEEKCKLGVNTTVLLIHAANLQHNIASASRVWHIYRELKRSGIKTILVGREASTDTITADEIIAIKPLLDGFAGNLLFLFQISAAVMRILFSTRIDVVLTRGCHLAPLMFLMKLCRKNIIYDFHGYAYKEETVEGRQLRAKTTKPFDWLALRLADHIITIREELRQDLPPDLQKKTLLLPNGVDLEEFIAPENQDISAKYNLPPNKKLVGFIGNWQAWIAIEDLLTSAQYLDENTKMVIIGSGQRLEEYKATYSSVLFTGRVPHRDAVGLLRRMDVCVCPYSTQLIAKNKSYRKVLEYLAAGKPIVSSNAEGREKFLKESENTLMYEAGHPEDLAEKVEAILNDERLYAKMRCNNLKLAQQFSWREVINHSGLIKILQGQQ